MLKNCNLIKLIYFTQVEYFKAFQWYWSIADLVEAFRLGYNEIIEYLGVLLSS